MKPLTVDLLYKKICYKRGGLIFTHDLIGETTFPVLWLAKVPTDEQLAKIREILQ